MTRQATKAGLWHRLYHGETAFDFVGRRRVWFVLSGLVILAGAVSLATKGLNYGIDFRGGTSWQVRAPGVSVTEARDALQPLGLDDANIQVLNTPGGDTLRVQSERLPGCRDPLRMSEPEKRQCDERKGAVSTRLADLAKTDRRQVSMDDVGPAWGRAVTNKARNALIVFFVLISAYISFRFEWKMAVAALSAVVHDIFVTVGVYSLSGFEVTPATVVAFLTILGYSLYDTIVVFDKVQENTRGLSASGRMTYADTVNLSMNQVLMRSLNTSLVAILPILSVLVIGSYAMGATTLQDFGLALLVGLITGAYSSIFIASPILAILKEREPRYANIRQRVLARGGAAKAPLTPAAAAAMGASGGGARGDVGGEVLVPAGETAGNGGARTTRTASSSANRPRSGNRPPPRPRKKGKRR